MFEVKIISEGYEHLTKSFKYKEVADKYARGLINDYDKSVSVSEIPVKEETTTPRKLAGLMGITVVNN